MLNRPKARRVRVRFSLQLKIEMQKAITKSQYGVRGKSKWLSDAIKKFVLRSDFVDLVKHGDSINQAELTEEEAFYLEDEILEVIEQALIQVRKEQPLFEGVKSAFIRACAINYI